MKAYDYSQHSHILKGLCRKGVPPPIVAAWIREMRRCSSVFVLDQDVQSGAVRRTRSLLQGDPAAPETFNSTLDIPASRFCDLAANRKWGVQLDDGTVIALILFADNFWLFARSPEELATITGVWLGMLAESGWKVPLDETTWCTTGPDENSHWTVEV